MRYSHNGELTARVSTNHTIYRLLFPSFTIICSIVYRYTAINFPKILAKINHQINQLIKILKDVCYYILKYSLRN